MTLRVGGTTGTNGITQTGGLNSTEQARLLDLVRGTKSQSPEALAQQLGLPLDGFTGGRIDQEVANLGRNSNTYTPGPGLDAVQSGGGTLHIGHRGDSVKDLQRMLNAMGANLAVDGKLGPQTEAALKAFQESRGMGSNGVLDANTLSKLQAGGPQIPQETLSRLTPQPRNTGGDPEIARRLDQMHASRPSTPQPGDVSPEQLQRIVGSGMSPDRAQQLAPHLNNAMREAGITTDRQKAAFISQLAHESGGFRHFEELASGRAYEGRRDLGNTQAGDGERFKGRGPIQLTGRANYQAAGRALGLDLENNPDLVSRPDVGFRVAAWYWNSRNINQTADRGDFVGVTRAINGGTNGLDDRMRYYERALGALA